MWWIFLACGAAPAPVHDLDAVALRDAIVRDDLVGARAAARRVADVFPWNGRGGPVDDAAGAIAAAPDLATAAANLGRLLVACAGCHHTSAGAPPAAPQGAEGVSAEMTRHQYGAEGLWRGILRRDEAEIRDAVSLLSAGSAFLSGSDVDPSLPPVGRQWEADVHRLAARVRDEPKARAEAYGELLLTCAVCHATVRDPR